ncbi:hypothetical protein ACVIJW_007374 [Bradyrhizobium barranii subsp. barranii]
MDARDFIKVGMSAERTLVVPAERTVGHFVPGMPMVYATPMMILEMEMTSGDAIRAALQPGWVTVGTEVDIRHLVSRSRRCDRADHREGGRGRAPRHPLRGRGIRGRAQARRGPPCAWARECRDVQQAASRRLETVVVGWAKARSAVPTIFSGSRTKLVGTLPPSLVELRRTSRFAHPTTPAYFASSFDRFVAAAIARIISSRRPGSPINTPSAAAVVPPGEVTFWRSVAEGSSD